jgi:hypothetical protein
MKVSEKTKKRGETPRFGRKEDERSMQARDELSPGRGGG